MRMLFFLGILGLAGCTGSTLKEAPKAPESLVCKTDADCVMFGFDGEDRCGPLCGTD